MKNGRLFIVASLVFFISFGYAQKRYSADSYLADPEKYQNQKVTIFVDEVDVPAINSSSNDDYRIFRVSTSGQEKGEFSYGGYIYVKVPVSDASAFVKRHNSRTGSAKNFSGVFRKMDSSTEYTHIFSYYIDCTK